MVWSAHSHRTLKGMLFRRLQNSTLSWKFVTSKGINLIAYSILSFSQLRGGEGAFWPAPQKAQLG